jgi:hypothetical protein
MVKGIDQVDRHALPHEFIEFQALHDSLCLVMHEERQEPAILLACRLKDSEEVRWLVFETCREDLEHLIHAYVHEFGPTLVGNE